MRHAAWIRMWAFAIALVALAASMGLAPAEAKGKPPGAGRGRDTTAPVITCPSGITVDPYWYSLGAWVTFTVSATDDKDPAPTVVASPSSGQWFPVGTTTVTVTATESAPIVALMAHMHRQGFVRTRLVRAYAEDEFQTILRLMPGFEGE